jgi:hypothetical protein
VSGVSSVCDVRGVSGCTCCHAHWQESACRALYRPIPSSQANREGKVRGERVQKRGRGDAEARQQRARGEPEERQRRGRREPEQSQSRARGKPKEKQERHKTRDIRQETRGKRQDAPRQLRPARNCLVCLLVRPPRVRPAGPPACWPSDTCWVWTSKRAMSKHLRG